MANSNRPTLPPLHSLGLLPRRDIPHPRVHEPHDLNEPSRPVRLFHVPSTPPYSRPRDQPPVSSSTAPQELSPLRPRTNTPPSTPIPTSTSTAPPPTRRIRLTPTSFENAEAVLLTAPPTAPNTPSQTLLVGPAIQFLRNSRCRLKEGARMQSYRVARGPSNRGSPTEPSNTKA